MPTTSRRTILRIMMALPSFIAHYCAASAINVTVGNMPPDIASPDNLWEHVKGGLDDIAKNVSQSLVLLLGLGPRPEAFRPIGRAQALGRNSLQRAHKLNLNG